ncbi:DNA polymerase domain-containing protein [Spongisporangium articulatum]|uniref:DNA polymerase domain-containing protein n=1 Tax=Spongisporangium articulatum TaxID=3362603 RepID=A0ABW8AM84_9ACTN
MPSAAQVIEVDGREVKVTNPAKVVFPELGITKLELVQYYLAVADGALRGVAGRPMVLKRFVKGIEEEAFFQKRAPANRPPYVGVAELKYASGRSAEEAVVSDAAGLAWAINVGCVDLNPHPLRDDDLVHPDELRIDLDPMPGVPWSQIVDVALVVRSVLEDHGLVGWPKTSGSRGMHINVRIARDWTFRELRTAAETVSREVELRAPEIATAKWWKEERGAKVFTDFNQNAYDRTVASVWSVRPTPDARVSLPLTWDEVPACDPLLYTMSVAVERFSDGDPWLGMDAAVGSLDALLARAEELGPAEKPPKGTGGRTMTMPLIEIARAKTKAEALEGLERWKSRHGAVFALLEPADVLLDGMRGSSSLWYRIRLNLQHVPEAQRPPQEPLEVDYDPWAGKTWPGRP